MKSATFPTAWLLFLLGFFLLLGYGSCVQIRHLRVPRVIENGTVTSIVLDCDYTYEDHETAGLVVQWFFGDHLAPVYQWVPGKRPQDLGMFRGRINLDHRASDDPYKMHRALQILKPTTELSGEYRCKVVTFDDEATAYKTMIVFAPARNLELWYHKVSTDTVNVTCQVEGIYPQPKMALYYEGSKRKEIDSLSSELQLRNGLYDVTIHHLLENNYLPLETIFECVAMIPGTEYQIRRKAIYYPGMASMKSSGNSYRGGLAGLFVVIATVAVF